MHTNHSAPHPLAASHLDEAAAVMTDALADSPAYKALVPGGGAWRRVVLKELFRVNISAVHSTAPHSIRCVRAADDDSIVAVYMILKPAERPSDWAMVRAGLFQVLWRVGVWEGLKMFWRTVRTMRWFSRFAKQAWAAGSGRGGGGGGGGSSSSSGDGQGRRKSAMVLERMSVRSDWQGRGIGTICVRDALEKAGESDAVVRLATQEERVVKFYKRLGFAVNAQHSFEADMREYSWTSWFMEHTGRR